MSLKEILEQETLKVKPSEEEMKYLQGLAKTVIDKLEKKIERKKIKAQVFLGGSLAKKTLIKKSKYDIDIFIRFDRSYSELEIKKHMKRIFFFLRIPGLRTKVKRIHGSRDYYKIHLKRNNTVVFEVVPTVKVTKPEDARNVTDLSYFHVNYVKKEASKDKNLLNNILLAKSFCHAQKVYGAESYIKGFSGYSLELLLCYYGDFKKFLTEMIDVKEKLIIDQEKLYSKKEDIEKNMNYSKLMSPIVIIDPTFKERNAASALSEETFKRFQKKAREFLKNPDERFFVHKRVDVPYLKMTAQELKALYGVFELKTKKQAGDIAGSKMLKFSNLLTRELEKYFNVIESEYDYWGEKAAHVYYVLKRKNEIVTIGPSIHYEEAAKRFKEKHRIWYVEEGKVKSARPSDISIKEFLKEFKRVHKKTMKQMDIKKIKLV